MSLAGLLVALFLTLVLLIIVLQPLRRQDKSVAQHSSHRELETRYQRVLINIRDLDEDYATGKLDARSYHDDRATWVRRGVDLLRQIDEQTRASGA